MNGCRGPTGTSAGDQAGGAQEHKEDEEQPLHESVSKQLPSLPCEERCAEKRRQPEHACKHRPVSAGCKLCGGNRSTCGDRQGCGDGIDAAYIKHGGERVRTGDAGDACGKIAAAKGNRANEFIDRRQSDGDLTGLTVGNNDRGGVAVRMKLEGGRMVSVLFTN